jgi:hypothetical protein
MVKLRALFESLVYAGLKPQAPGAAAPKPAGAWRQRFEEFLTKPADADPLYLSNRTIWQTMRAWVALLVPAVLVLAVLAIAWSGVFRGKDGPKPKELTAAEKAARILPNFNARIQLPVNRDLDVQDAHVEHGSPTRIAGLVTNNTDHAIASAEVSFDLIDARGSRLGAVSTAVENLPPHSATPFRFAVAQDAADHVLVRDYQTH